MLQLLSWLMRLAPGKRRDLGNRQPCTRVHTYARGIRRPAELHWGSSGATEVALTDLPRSHATAGYGRWSGGFAGFGGSSPCSYLYIAYACNFSRIDRGIPTTYTTHSKWRLQVGIADDFPEHLARLGAVTAEVKAAMDAVLMLGEPFAKASAIDRTVIACDGHHSGF